MQKGPDEHALVRAHVYEGANNGTVKVRQNCGGTVLKQVPDRPEKARQGQPQEQKEDQVIEEANPSPPVVRHETCPKAQVLGQGQEAAHLLVDRKVPNFFSAALTQP